MSIKFWNLNTGYDDTTHNSKAYPPNGIVQMFRYNLDFFQALKIADVNLLPEQVFKVLVL